MDGDAEFVQTGYGKNIIKVLHIKRDGKCHSIKELEVNIQLTLKSKKDYLYGDNSDIIPTDTMKNTVYALAKLKGIQTVEEFAMDICEHFLSSFNHVTEVKVFITEAPWKRLEKNGEGHAHAFIYSPDGTRFCELEQKQGGDKNILNLSMITAHKISFDRVQTGPPLIRSGIKDLKVLKTTQSGFEGFIKDRFTTLPEVKDRCFSTIVNCKWTYSHSKGINFDAAWKTVWESILETFAGPYATGEYSPSVQKTLYDMQLLCLKRVPEIETIEIILPNKHYFTIDMSKFGLDNKDEVLLPSDNPFGNITGTVRRKPAAKL